MLEDLPADIPEGAKYKVAEIVRRWGLLADLCFSDLLMYVKDPTDPTRVVVVSQIRPTTASTVHQVDMVGAVFSKESASSVFSSFLTNSPSFQERLDQSGQHKVVSQALPVPYEGTTVAVLVRDFLLNPQRVQGELEATYVSLFERIAKMIYNGDFPYAGDDLIEAPRVGDGVVVLGADGAVQFMSPNAVSALHRLGCRSPRRGASLFEMALPLTGPTRAALEGRPELDEIERKGGIVVTFLSLPLLDKGTPTGTLVLLRDVTDLRSKDRLILSKDATIKEIHHRVKNNLQTISSLLRLQARRIESPRARQALYEAERRIRSIALVHEALSREVGEQAPMGQVIEAIEVLATESAPAGINPIFRVRGELGEVDASVATPLAVVMAELMQNSVEHAFARAPIGSESDLVVNVDLVRQHDRLEVRISDNGIGFPDDFDLSNTTSLGLSIVRDLVVSQLSGTINIRMGPGAEVFVSVPLKGPDE
ncbi:MAG: ATPase [Acidimicrobiaceae bacterium]|nr:ATPase [Acidimicrobiaceae bacterium]